MRAQTPVQVKFECLPQDIDAFGLDCTDSEPCEVLLDLSAVDIAGDRILAGGNLHTAHSTLYSILLASNDNGVTWSEPFPRQHNSAIEQFQFFTPQTGWASGQSIDPLPREPFMLLTSDGGRTWRQRPVSDDTVYGSVAQFHFDSEMNGELVVDASHGKTMRQELYQTRTGGESWELKQTSNTPLRLKNRPTASAAPLRFRPDAKSGTLLLERGRAGARTGTRAWDPIASFAIRVAECR